MQVLKGRSAIVPVLEVDCEASETFLYCIAWVHVDEFGVNSVLIIVPQKKGEYKSKNHKTQISNAPAVSQRSDETHFHLTVTRINEECSQRFEVLVSNF